MRRPVGSSCSPSLASSSPTEIYGRVNDPEAAEWVRGVRIRGGQREASELDEGGHHVNRFGYVARAVATRAACEPGHAEQQRNARVKLPETFFLPFVMLAFRKSGYEEEAASACRGNNRMHEK